MAAKKKTRQNQSKKLFGVTPLSQIRPIKILTPREIFHRARELPIHGCWIMEGWQQEGITPVTIARMQENGNILFGNYLMDVFCLGVKDAFSDFDIPLSSFNRKLGKLCAGAPEVISVELAHEVVYGGLEYARRYGFEPHSDFTAMYCDLVLDPPDAHPRSGTVVFGQNGKPFYVSGPYDDEKRIASIHRTLMRTAGEGNFEFTVPLGNQD